jgi:hypothetical protein
MAESGTRRLASPWSARRSSRRANFLPTHMCSAQPKENCAPELRRVMSKVWGCSNTPGSRLASE